MSDTEKLAKIRELLVNKPVNYGGYIENALDIDEDLLSKIERILAL